MYGKTSADFPSRVVCLTAETAEITCLVGAGDRVVGGPGTARRPDAVRDKPKGGGVAPLRVAQNPAPRPAPVLALSGLAARGPPGAVAGGGARPRPHQPA